MKEAYRFDRGSLRPPRETPQGFLRVNGYATRLGVLEYDDPSYPDGIRRELRLPEDLFEPGSLATYEGAVVTDDHPPEMVTPSNASTYAKGTVLSAARRDGDHVAVDFQVTDADLIAKVRGGKLELSSGYKLKLDETPGVHPVHGRYDARQRDIVINHLAIVSVGRSGPTSRIRMDSVALDSAQRAFFEQLRVQRNPTDTKDQDHMDPNKQIEQLQAQLQAVNTAFGAEKLRADAAESKLKGETARADAAEGQISVLTGTVAQLRSERRDDALIASKDAEIASLAKRLDEAEKKVAALPDQIANGVKVRVDLERQAAAVMPALNMDGLSDRDVMLTVLQARGVTVDVERGDAHLSGAFKVAVDNWKAGEAALARLGSAGVERADAASKTVRTSALTAREARDRMIARNRGARVD